MENFGFTRRAIKSDRGSLRENAGVTDVQTKFLGKKKRF